MKKLLIISILTLLSACAKGPDAIAPVPLGDAYTGLSCDQANKTLIAERQTLAALEKQQRNARVGDTVGVFLLLLPVSSITGNDVEGKLATSKGKVIALEQRALSC
ncbi:hypothetical protein [Roseobacter sp.]|uniref:hypothetical protein n=1 Tax=Roseobacter sp. TaxID=1907202 RepID=UPI00329690BC